jgi:adenine-specific DNA-methyltransferase
MEKLDPKTDGATPDIVEQNIEKMKTLFPDVFTEGKVDLDALREALGDYADERQERYSFTWNGKARARRIAQTPSTGTLRPCPEESVNWDTTQNLFIEGDNLEVLKLLQKSYHKKVKMIYIDPPYNTGKEFIYPDRFQDNLDTYLRYTGQVDDEGLKLSANTESSGRYHTNWLNMMLPRLKLARNLLSDDGVVFVSVDDNEASNLKLLLDEVFGSENHLVTHYVQVRYASKTLAEKNDYQKLIEQVLVYQRASHTPRKKTEEYSLDKFCWQIVETKPGEKITLGGRDVEVFPEGHYEITKVESSIEALKETWATGSVLIANASGKFFGTHLAPRKDVDGLGVLYKVYGIGEDGLGFRYFTGPKRETATKGKFYSGVPTTRVEELEAGSSLKSQPIPNFYDFAANFGNCRHEGETDFRSGKKPIAFLSELINQAVDGNEEAVILDFFAGSASTAHAVIDLNNGDNGNRSNRRFVMVQLPEPCNGASDSNAADCATIADIGKERIRRVIKKLEEERAAKAKEAQGSLLKDDEVAPELDLGFKVFKLDASNIKPWDADFDNLETALFDAVDNIKPERSEADVLYELLLKYGLDLAVPIEEREIAGKTVYIIGAGALIVCLAKKISLEVVEGIAALKEELKPEVMRVVFKDAGFADDVVKTNAVQILRQAEIEDVKSL